MHNKRRRLSDLARARLPPKMLGVLLNKGGTRNEQRISAALTSPEYPLHRIRELRRMADARVQDMSPSDPKRSHALRLAEWLLMIERNRTKSVSAMNLLEKADKVLRTRSVLVPELAPSKSFRTPATLTVVTWPTGGLFGPSGRGTRAERQREVAALAKSLAGEPLVKQSKRTTAALNRLMRGADEPEMLNRQVIWLQRQKPTFIKRLIQLASSERLRLSGHASQKMTHLFVLLSAINAENNDRATRNAKKPKRK